MTLQEILDEIPRLSTREQLVVLQVLSRALNESVAAGEAPVSERLAVVDRLYGALRPEGELSTAEKLREGYTDYLNKKYS